MFLKRNIFTILFQIRSMQNCMVWILQNSLVALFTLFAINVFENNVRKDFMIVLLRQVESRLIFICVLHDFSEQTMFIIS